MLRRLHLAAAGLAGILSLAGSASAVVLVNDTWKDGTDADPVFGDANFDDVGGVNGGDFIIWQRNVGLMGTGTNALGDANFDTNVNDDDLDIWRQQYGAPNDAPAGYSENGVDGDGDGDIESAWFRGGTGELDPVGMNGPLRGYTHNPADGMNPSTSSSSWTTYFKPPGEKVVLANAGDSLKVTWKFSLTNVNASNASQSFRFGVVDSGTRVTAANGSPPTGIYAGYAIWGNMGQTLGHSNSFQLRARTSTVADTLFNNSDDFGLTLGNGASSTQTGYAEGVEYTMTWIMTRGIFDSLVLDVSMAGGMLGNDMSETDGVIQVMFEDGTPNTFQFDTFAIRPSQEAQTATEFLTSQLMVEFLPGTVISAVSEPTSAASAALAAAVGLGATRRRRR